MDLTILRSGHSKRRGAGINAILKAEAPIGISEELEEELKRSDEVTGGGSAETLKAIKVSNTNHSDEKLM